MIKLIKNWQWENSEAKAPRKVFHLRAADPEMAEKLTGFSFNAVTPFLWNEKIPIVVDENLNFLTPKLFWMGGGHKDTKMRIGLDEFVGKSEFPIIMGDVSILRDDFDDKSQDEV